MSNKPKLNSKASKANQVGAREFLLTKNKELHINSDFEAIEVFPAHECPHNELLVEKLSGKIRVIEYSAYAEIENKYDKLNIELRLEYIKRETQTAVTQLSNERKKVEGLKKALEFYANKDNYGSDDKSRTTGKDCYDIVLFDFDRGAKEDFAGSRARAALKLYNEGKEGGEHG